MVTLKLSQLKKLANNPRTITRDDMEKLKASIRKFGVLPARPLIVSDRTGELVIIGGNQRYEAYKALWISDVPVEIMSGLSYEDECEIIIRDNISNGEWDMDAIANEWSEHPLDSWGLDVGFEEEPEEILDDQYTAKIEAPVYAPTGKNVTFSDMVDTTKQRDLEEKIKNSSLDEKTKDFLITASHRFSVFNYSNIAEFYAQSDKDVQSLMEDLALVIIDFNKAIENGFVKMSENIASKFNSEE